MKKYNKQEQRMLAIWAADCAERVLPFFERVYKKDKRPRKAIKECRKWVRTGVFSMSVIRGASLSAHAAARRAMKNKEACYAARAAGQAVATAHVAQHAFGAAYYSLKIVAADDSADIRSKIAREIDWQTRHLPRSLRQEWRDWLAQYLPKSLRIYYPIWKGP